MIAVTYYVCKNCGHRMELHANKRNGSSYIKYESTGYNDKKRTDDKHKPFFYE